MGSRYLRVRCAQLVADWADPAKKTSAVHRNQRAPENGTPTATRAGRLAMRAVRSVTRAPIETGPIDILLTSVALGKPQTVRPLEDVRTGDHLLIEPPVL